MNVLDRIQRALKKRWRKLERLRLQPIRVFLFHQVSDEFDDTTMCPCDWTETEQFKNNITFLKNQYVFISLDLAYRKMRRDVFRFRKYAVLTSDDGWASLMNILPWLNEQQVPVTLFLNPGYFDGVHYREKSSERYLLKKDIIYLSENYPNISIGMHGWEHTNATMKSEEEFRDEVMRTVDALKPFSGYVPFYAYTWGKYNLMTERVLNEFRIIPVLIDGEKNIDDLSCIHRELLDGVKL